MVQLTRFGFFGYIQLNQCIKITNKLAKLDEFIPDKIYVLPMELKATIRMFSNSFYPLVIIADRDDRHQDVFHLTDALTGINIYSGHLYPLSALAEVNSSIP